MIYKSAESELRTQFIAGKYSQESPHTKTEWSCPMSYIRSFRQFLRTWVLVGVCDRTTAEVSNLTVVGGWVITVYTKMAKLLSMVHIALFKSFQDKETVDF